MRICCKSVLRRPNLPEVIFETAAIPALPDTGERGLFAVRRDLAGCMGNSILCAVQRKAKTDIM